MTALILPTSSSALETSLLRRTQSSSLSGVSDTRFPTATTISVVAPKHNSLSPKINLSDDDSIDDTQTTYLSTDSVTDDEQSCVNSIVDDAIYEKGKCSKHSSDGATVRFSTITVREYPRILGDNITVRGPPISMSWNHSGEKVYDLNDYDLMACGGEDGTRRLQAELKMPSIHRIDLLRNDGYTWKEIQEATKQSTLTRNRRKRTLEMIHLQPLHELFEKVTRKVVIIRRK